MGSDDADAAVVVGHQPVPVEVVGLPRRPGRLREGPHLPVELVEEVPRERRRALAYVLMPALLFLAVAMMAENSGVRHLLPAYGLLTIAASAGTVALATRCRWVLYAVPALLVVHAGSSLWAFPFYLSYENELAGGPSRTYRHLPYMDMGEGLKEVKAYVEGNHTKPCWIVSPYLTDPTKYDTGCEPLMYYTSRGWVPKPMPEVLDGTVFVSGSFLQQSGVFPTVQQYNTGWFTWLRRDPDSVLAGSSVLVYRGRFDAHALALDSEHAAAYLAMDEQKYDEALQHARRAAEIDPQSAIARAVICVSLVWQGAEARTPCEVAAAQIASAPPIDPDITQEVDRITQAYRSGLRP